MSEQPSRGDRSIASWPVVEWKDRSDRTYRLAAQPMHNNELRFDVSITDRDGEQDRPIFCSNLTPRSAAEIKQRLTDYLDFMADKAVS